MSAKKDTETNPSYKSPFEDPTAFIWTSHPATHNGKRTSLLILLLLVIFVAVYFTTRSSVLTVVAVFIMFGSLSTFFLPTSYAMDEKGVYIKTLSGIRSGNWEKYRSFYPDKNGVFLSPFTRPRRIENFRGIYIRFSENRTEVLAFVERSIKSANRREEDSDVVS